MHQLVGAVAVEVAEEHIVVHGQTTVDARVTRTNGELQLTGAVTDDTGTIGVDTFALKPKWPGLVAFLLMFFTGYSRSASQILRDLLLRLCARAPIAA